MKNKIKVLAIVLALGATVQAIKAYANESVSFSVEEEEEKMSKLIAFRREITKDVKSLAPDEEIYNEDFPHITDGEKLNEAIAEQVLRYIQAIGAEEALVKVMKKPEFHSFSNRTDPGI